MPTLTEAEKRWKVDWSGREVPELPGPDTYDQVAKLYDVTVSELLALEKEIEAAESLPYIIRAPWLLVDDA